MTLGVITKTALDVATYVKRQFGDESGIQVTDADIFRWINSGQLYIVQKNKTIKAKATANIVAAQRDYTLPSQNILQLESLHYDGKFLPSLSLAEFQAQGADINEPGTPTMWYEWAGTISLWPVPEDSITDGLTIFYTKLPTAVSATSDLLSIPDQYFEAILSWVLSKAYELDEDYEASNNQRALFSQFLDETNEEERTAQHMTYPVITIVE